MLKTVPELVAEARVDLRCVNAATAMAEVNDNQGTIIDVRELVEVEQLGAPHSLNIPRGILEMKITGLVPDEQHPLYIHCATGGRATFAAEQLRRLGYQQVTVITCPIDTVVDQQKLLRPD